MADALDLTIQIIEGSGGFGTGSGHPSPPRHRRKSKTPACTRQALDIAVERANALLLQRNLPYQFLLEEHADSLTLVLGETAATGAAMVRHLERGVQPEGWAMIVEALNRLDGMFLDCHM